VAELVLTMNPLTRVEHTEAINRWMSEMEI